MARILCTAALAVFWLALPAAGQEVRLAWLEKREPPQAVLSNLDPIPADEGLAGAMVGLAENTTTGRFLDQTYKMESFIAAPGEDFIAKAEAALTSADLVIVKAGAADLLNVADLPESARKIIFNVAAPDSALRDTDCRANLLHTLPSRAMLADSLAQFAVFRKWTDWALIAGPRPGDQALAAAFETSAKKYRLRIRGRKDWTFDADMRRSASSEVPLFTQGFKDHDLLVVADEANDFARYVIYNTWEPRPVAGSEGIVPAAWSPAVEQYGAAQLQSRFTEQAGRQMRPVDWAAWAAVRTVGEAVTRTDSTDPVALRSYILGDDFQLGGFKGRALSYRDWNGQLRQTIPLSHAHAVVALAPLPGFLHQRNELDTLGLDRPESRCEAFGRN